MLNHTRTTIHVIAVTVFSCCLIISGLLLYFAVEANSGGPGDRITNFLEALLMKQQSVFALFGAVLTALPAMTLGITNPEDGQLTKRGKIYLWILIPTLLLASVANIILEPGMDLGYAGTPALADTTALRLAAYALTFLTAFLGLKTLAPKAG
jgi:hypothetical protein